MNPAPRTVAVLLGSTTDLPYVQGGLELLDRFGIGYTLRILSAHRTPHEVHQFAAGAANQGYRVFICVAGGAAHLAGTVAAMTLLPVIGVPLPTSPLGGLDALYATSQMPAGVPVATMAVGEAGVLNAALLAAQILALVQPELGQVLADYRKDLAAKVLESDRERGVRGEE